MTNLFNDNYLSNQVVSTTVVQTNDGPLRSTQTSDHLFWLDYNNDGYYDEVSREVANSDGWGSHWEYSPDASHWYGQSTVPDSEKGGGKLPENDKTIKSMTYLENHDLFVDFQAGDEHFIPTFDSMWA